MNAINPTVTAQQQTPDNRPTTSTTGRLSTIFSLKSLVVGLALTSPTALGRSLGTASKSSHLARINNGSGNDEMFEGRHLLKKGRSRSRSRSRSSGGSSSSDGSGGNSLTSYSAKLEVGKGKNETPLLLEANGIHAFTVFNQITKELQDTCNVEYDLTSADEGLELDFSPLGYQKEVAGGQTTGDFTNTDATLMTTTQAKLDQLGTLDNQGNPLTDAQKTAGAQTMAQCLEAALEQGIKSNAPSAQGSIALSIAVAGIAAGLIL